MFSCTTRGSQSSQCMLHLQAIPVRLVLHSTGDDRMPSGPINNAPAWLSSFSHFSSRSKTDRKAEYNFQESAQLTAEGGHIHFDPVYDHQQILWWQDVHPKAMTMVVAPIQKEWIPQIASPIDLLIGVPCLSPSRTGWAGCHQQRKKKSALMLFTLLYILWHGLHWVQVTHRTQPQCHLCALTKSAQLALETESIKHSNLFNPTGHAWIRSGYQQTGEEDSKKATNGEAQNNMASCLSLQMQDHFSASYPNTKEKNEILVLRTMPHSLAQNSINLPYPTIVTLPT